MNSTERLEVYKAQCSNVVCIEKALNQTKRAINEYIRRNKTHEVSNNTKIYALIYSAWAEVSFSKMIHTPYGFNLDQISKIKRCHKDNGITAAWNMAVDIAIIRSKAKRSGFNDKAKERLKELIKELIHEPSIIRNKIAHGQWSTPLNNKGTGLNLDAKTSIDNLDISFIEFLYKSQKELSQLIEHLIESPNRTFVPRHWIYITNIENIRNEYKTRNSTTKSKVLRPKKIVISRIVP